MYKHILVTGGAGFAGSTLCLALRREFEGVRVTAFDNLKRRGSERNLPRLQASGVEFLHGDVRNSADLSAVKPHADLIIECSAEPSAQAGYGGSPDYLLHTNLTGCYHCLDLARTTGADILFLSTSRVYPYRELNALAFEENESRFVLSAKQEVPGVSERGVTEQFPLNGARSLYGMTKLAAELMVEEFSDAYGFRFVIDRFGLLTGPYQMAKADQGVIALWVAAHFFGRPLSYIGFGGSGKQVRDFLHVDDFCDLVLDQVRHFDLYAGGRFNAGGGVAHSLSLLESTALCEQISGRNIAMGSIPENRTGDVRIYLTDSTLVESLSAWRPRRDAAFTVESILRWLHADGEQLRPVLGW